MEVLLVLLFGGGVAFSYLRFWTLNEDGGLRISQQVLSVATLGCLDQKYVFQKIQLGVI